MQTQFKTIGLIGKPIARVAPTLTSLYQHLCKLGIRALVEHKSAHMVEGLQPQDDSSIENIGRRCDLAIAIGGDGTFLSAGRAVADYGVPLIGVNQGRLGFLVDISPQTVLSTLDKILEGQYQSEERSFLVARIIRDGQTIHEQKALNEVVIHRWITPSMLEIITHIDGDFLNVQRSDGLIVSTPTGTTAYALSGGGPILHPGLRAMALVPINPHTLSNRPIVIDDSRKIEIAFSQNKQIRAQVSCDEVSIPDVLTSDIIHITRSPTLLKILHPAEYDFFDILRVKLNWSS